MDEPNIVQEETAEEVIEAPIDSVEEIQEEDNAVKKDRTKQQIEKLKAHNQELKEQAETYKNLFESLRPAEPQIQVPDANNYQNLNQAQVDQAYQSMVDENGYLDGNKLMSTLHAMDARAKKAEAAVEEIKSERQAETTTKREREEKEATLKVYEKYPQLDPTNIEGVDKDGEVIKFDPKMWQYVYNELAATAKKGQMPSDTDYMTAADQVYQDFYEGREMNKKQKEQATVKEDQKLQINATRPRSSIEKGYYENQEEDVLVSDVRTGKRGAVAALLRKRGL